MVVSMDLLENDAIFYLFGLFRYPRIMTRDECKGMAMATDSKASCQEQEEVADADDKAAMKQAMHIKQQSKMKDGRWPELGELRASSKTPFDRSFWIFVINVSC